MGQITVMTGPERRRRWSEEERIEILAEAFDQPDLHMASQVARTVGGCVLAGTGDKFRPGRARR